MIERATVTAPEMIGLLVWWIVVLAVPVIAGLRWRRRRSAERTEPAERTLIVAGNATCRSHR